ncbi:hypothetical protein PoB_003543100 [Plakobranchus ocellatus]|uniref:Uncharacterized protein n=1 Tax=Plakobranchus ocellatus TaxID=259542 RepID=A0AAV4AQT0_9GAST|nr:hypothetical protein PoB_003543100 [Plakobranchus ocellatus]
MTHFHQEISGTGTTQINDKPKQQVYLWRWSYGYCRESTNRDIGTPQAQWHSLALDSQVSVVGFNRHSNNLPAHRGSGQSANYFPDLRISANGASRPKVTITIIAIIIIIIIIIPYLTLRAKRKIYIYIHNKIGSNTSNPSARVPTALQLLVSYSGRRMRSAH